MSKACYDVGMEMIRWKPEPESDLSRSQVEFLLNSGAKARVEEAFAEGLLIDYAVETLGADNSDLKIVLTFRHKSKIPALQALPETPAE